MSNSPFVFRGTRNYVLVVDVLYAVLDLLNKSNTATNIDYIIKQPCTTQSIKLLPSQEASATDQLKAMGIFTDDESSILVLPCGEKVQTRVACNETEIAQHFTYSTEDNIPPEVYVAHLQENTTLAHNIVVAFKYLLNEKVMLTQRSYVFARLKLDTLNIEQFSIKYIRFFANRFFEGHIFSQGKQVGAIYFGGQRK